MGEGRQLLTKNAAFIWGFGRPIEIISSQFNCWPPSTNVRPYVSLSCLSFFFHNLRLCLFYSLAVSLITVLVTCLNSLLRRLLFLSDLLFLRECLSYSLLPCTMSIILVFCSPSCMCRWSLRTTPCNFWRVRGRNISASSMLCIANAVLSVLIKWTPQPIPALRICQHFFIISLAAQFAQTKGVEAYP